MPRLIMMRGLPASGKSTRAKEVVAQIGNGNAKIINKDLLRLMLDAGHWSAANEKFILKARDALVIATLQEGKHVIVDDTNLSSRHEERLRQLASENGASFEILDFSHVPVEECLKRDAARPNYVGPDTILRMHYQFLVPAIPRPALRPALPHCVIVDLDGTLADLSVSGRDPYDASTCYQDGVRDVILEVAKALTRNRNLILVSGRSNEHRYETKRWLYDKCDLALYELHMRATGDCRKDAIVKREIYETYIEPRYNVFAIIDDRPQVVRLWQSLGFADCILNVGTGREF